VAPLSASKIIIITKDRDSTGRGRISAGDGKLELAVILEGDRELPRSEGRMPSDQFWKIGRIIEDQVPVWTVGLPHQWNTHHELFSTRERSAEVDPSFADRFRLLWAPFAGGAGFWEPPHARIIDRYEKVNQATVEVNIWRAQADCTVMQEVVAL
jgi:hypothetical protein